MPNDAEKQNIDLNKVVVLFRSQDRYEEAITIAEAACTQAQQELGPQHPFLATSLNNLAELYRLIASYTQAETSHQQALKIRQTLYGKAHKSTAGSMRNLVALYLTTGDYSKAEPLLQEILEMQQGALRETPLEIAQTQAHLALLHKAKGEYAQAKILYQQVLDTRRDVLGAEDSSVATILNNLAELLAETGHYNEAMYNCQQALAIKQKANAQSEVATCLNTLARLYFLKGEYQQAEIFYQQALALQYTLLGRDHEDIARTLNDMAELQHAQGNYQQAELLLRQAVELWNTETGPIHPHMAVSLNNLGELYRELSSYKKAAPYYQQALAMNRRARGAEHPYEATIFNNIAELYRQTGNYEQAESFYQQSFAIRQSKLGYTHPDSAQSLNNLATLAYIRGNWKQAENLYEQALAIRQASQGADHPDVAQTINNIALLAYDQGEYTKAEQLMQQAISITRKARGESHIAITSMLDNLASLYATTSRQNEAFTLMTKAATINDQIIGQVFSLGSEYQRMQFLKRLLGSFDGFLSLLCQFFVSEPDAVQAGFDLVLKRKGIGIEALAIQHDVQLSQRYPKLRELLSLRGQIAQKTLTGTGTEGIKAHQETLEDWNRQREDLEADLARQIPEMNLTSQLQIAHHQTIADMLPQNSVLVDFICFDRLDFHAPHIPGQERKRPRRYIAFVIRPGKIPVRLIDIGDATSVNKLVLALITTMTETSLATRNFNTRHAKTVEETYNDIAVKLSTTYFSSLFTALEGCSQVFLSPDGELARLPFEILPLEQGGMLIDQYHISYLSASRDLLRFQLPANHPVMPPQVLGDPDFDLQQEAPDINSPSVEGYPQSIPSPMLRFAPLPGTRLECQQIASLLGVDPILGSEATETVLREAHSPHILHIATHGFFFPDQRTNDKKGDKPDMTVSSFARSRLEDFLEQHVENPLLRSGLALAGINTWNQRKTTIEGTGILTAEDVSGLDLAATELVILSACETGLGEIQIGEGVFGLRRTFVLAGARTLIMSLWKIPDEQTQEFMREFYHALLAGQARAEALRTAQLTIKKLYPHPYYWGAFICQGDPSPLRNKRVPRA